MDFRSATVCNVVYQPRCHPVGAVHLAARTVVQHDGPICIVALVGAGALFPRRAAALANAAIDRDVFQVKVGNGLGLGLASFPGCGSRVTMAQLGHRVTAHRGV